MKDLKVSQYSDDNLRQLVRRYIHSSVARDVDDVLVGYDRVVDAVQAVMDGEHSICAIEVRDGVAGIYNVRTRHWEAISAPEDD